MRVKPFRDLELWLVAGSQDLYGEEPLRQVDEHTRKIAAGLDASVAIPVAVRYRGVAQTTESIRQICLQANADDACIGVIAWMHTFSPAKMWISGLITLRKPLLHMHTQFNRELPWADLDMDFMNLNQSAHGDREFGFLATRMRLRRKTVAGHWSAPGVEARIGSWARAACGWREAQRLKVARLGDNMREVAVTEGDKVEAQLQLGVSVNGYGIGELERAVSEVADGDVDRLVGLYEREYELVPALRVDGNRRSSLREAARIEAGLRAFLAEGGFHAFTDTFEDLGKLPQLPGLAVQRVMADGYGFGAEGDWKMAALVRIMKVMGSGLEGGCSFMEDYTYDLTPGCEKVLGAHMLEVCPSLAADRPSCEIHRLSVGGKADPVRLVFTARPGPAVIVSMVDLGHRFRLLVNEVDVVPPDAPLDRLEVACAVWRPKPDLVTSAEAWLTAGGPHHTVLSSALAIEPVADFAEIADIELVTIDRTTRLRELVKELRWSDAYYQLKGL